MARRKQQDLERLLSGQPINALKEAADSYTNKLPGKEENAAQRLTEAHTGQKNSAAAPENPETPESVISSVNRKKSTRLYIRIREDKKEALSALADREGLTLSAYITMLLEQKLKEENRRKSGASDPVTPAPSSGADPEADRKPAKNVLRVYTMQEAADLLRVQPRTVSNYIKSGRLKAAKAGGEWRITLDALKDFVGV